MGGPLDDFYKDCLRFGCLKCFKHFSLYLRGREELLVTVYHGDEGSPKPGIPIGFGAKGLPPASPAGKDPSLANPGETVFLVGAYARYNWPYVWLRSSNSKIGGDNPDKDLPLDLNSTQNWKAMGFRVWDIVEELVVMNVLPSPANPFEVVHDQVQAMPQLERALLAGALGCFLRDLLLRQGGTGDGEIRRDLRLILAGHFKDIKGVLEGHGDTAGRLPQGYPTLPSK